tara:strand:- start:1695 stop:4118 length:2424 start_codon:yes stop_codon:yes gene_type:complete
MAESVMKNYFPSQAVSDLEKMSLEYGTKVAKAIESEWFNSDSNKSYGRYFSYKNDFNKLRLYSRGEQSVKKYKDELSINGDLSYLNLDWKPVPIIPKFVDIVVNGLSQRTYDIKAYSQDPFGVEKRTEYMESILRDIRTKDYNNMVAQATGVDLTENDGEDLPQNEEELKLHMQLTYKQAIEIAEEQAINMLLQGSDYELIKRRFFNDLTVLGIGAVKTNFNTSEGVVVDYVDPANLVYSHTDSPYFDDVYYVGEVKTIPINELVKQFPNLAESDIEGISKSNYGHRNRGQYGKNDDYDKNHVQVLYFNYKTYMNEVYKVKEVGSGAEKAIPKDDTFNPPEGKEGSFTKLQRSIECLYEGVYVLNSNKLLKWEMASNMMRPKSDYTKVKMNYSIVAPHIYEGRIDSLVKRITGFADMIQLTHLKLQQVMSRLVPDGVYLDADGLAEIDLGNGTNYNPQEALNMFFQTGSVIGRSMNELGEQNAGRIPIQEISSGSGGAKMQSLIGTYNYYLQMIRDVTGLNEARDGSSPDKNALVGVQKLAAANSNTATRHILQAGLFLTAETAEKLSLRISDVLEYSPTKDAFVHALGAHNVATLEEMSNLHLYDFGIFLDLMPDEEEKQLLENNIAVALGQQLIDLEDAIDIREIQNLKLANQMLKIRRRKKQDRDQELQQQNIQAQAQANAQSQQVAAQSEVQKQQALMSTQVQLEQVKSDLKTKQMEREVQLKKELMMLEFDINKQLTSNEEYKKDARDKEREDRKDERTKIQASQQSELIDQRSNSKPPKKFESSGNDILGGGFGLESFDPK